MKPYKAIWLSVRPAIVDKKIVKITEPIEVRVMALAGVYAMVRRGPGMPFVVGIKELNENPPPQNQ